MRSYLRHRNGLLCHFEVFSDDGQHDFNHKSSFYHMNTTKCHTMPYDAFKYHHDTEEKRVGRCTLKKDEKTHKLNLIIYSIAMSTRASCTDDDWLVKGQNASACHSFRTMAAYQRTMVVQ